MNTNSANTNSISPNSWRNMQPTPKENNRMPMYIGLVCLLILLLVGGGAWALMNKDSNDDSTSSSSSSTSISSSSSSSSSSFSSSTTTTSSSSSTTSSSSSSAGSYELEGSKVYYEATDSFSFKRCESPAPPCYHYILPNDKKNIFPLLDPGSVYIINAETLTAKEGAAGNQYFTMGGDIKIYIQAEYKEQITGVGQTPTDQAKNFLVFDTVVSSEIESGSHSYTEHLMLNDELLDSIFPFLKSIQPGQKVKIYTSSLKDLGSAAGNHYRELGGAIEIEKM